MQGNIYKIMAKETLNLIMHGLRFRHFASRGTLQEGSINDMDRIAVFITGEETRIGFRII